MLRTAVLGALCLSVAAPAFAGAVETIDTKRIASGLAFPTYVTHAPGDTTRLFILEKKGIIKILNLADNSINATPFLNIDPIVVGGSSIGDEQGLLGLAFHPDYATNGFFFVYYTAVAGGGDMTLARFKVSANPNVATPTGTPLLTVDDPQTNHNGGWIHFGPDGQLYIAFGDGGAGNDTGAGHTAATGNAQDITSNKLGKMLRIDVDGADGIPGNDDDDGDVDGSTNGYTNPADNPFINDEDGDDEIWAYGLRNPWQCSFDRLTGDIWIGDVGQGAWEEIDFQPANLLGSMPGDAGYMGGRNYGWRCMEGNHCTGLTGCTCNDVALIDPIHEYFHTAGQSKSVSGGVVYRGCAIPSLQGTYFFSEYVAGTIWSLKYNGAAVTDFTTRSELTTSVDGFTCNQVVSFGEDANGEVYIVDHGGATSGQIFKIIPAVSLDCNANGTDDDCDIALGTTPDCNSNGIPDSCDLQTTPDCNGNGVPDSCDIAGGEPDTNANGIPDICEPGDPADLNNDGIVDGADLGLLLGGWGTCPLAGSCNADIDGNGEVDGADLGLLLSAWSE